MKIGVGIDTLSCIKKELNHLNVLWESKYLSGVLTMPALARWISISRNLYSKRKLFWNKRFGKQHIWWWWSGNHDDHLNRLDDLIVFGSQEFHSYEDPPTYSRKKPHFSLVRALYKWWIVIIELIICSSFFFFFFLKFVCFETFWITFERVSFIVKHTLQLWCHMLFSKTKMNVNWHLHSLLKCHLNVTCLVVRDIFNF